MIDQVRQDVLLGVSASERRRRAAYAGDVDTMRRILTMPPAEIEERQRRLDALMRALGEQHGQPYARRVLEAARAAA